MSATYRLPDVLLSKEILRSQVFLRHKIIVNDRETADSGEDEILCNLCSQGTK
jgi:hypothetical protein